MKVERNFPWRKISFAKLIKRKKTFDCIKIESSNYWSSECSNENSLKISLCCNAFERYELKINQRLTPKNLRKIRTLNDYLKTVKVQFILLTRIKNNESNKKIIDMIFNKVTIDIDVDLGCMFLIPLTATVNLLRIEDINCDEEFNEDFQNLIEYFISLGIKGIRSVYKTELREKLLNYFEGYEVFRKLQHEGDESDRITIVLDKGLIT